MTAKWEELSAFLKRGKWNTVKVSDAVLETVRRRSGKKRSS